jgi:hypothetical protein
MKGQRVGDERCWDVCTTLHHHHLHLCFWNNFGTNTIVKGNIDSKTFVQAMRLTFKTSSKSYKTDFG